MNQAAKALDRSLESHLNASFFGQSELATSVLPYFEAAFENLAPSRRPAGVFLCVGPTGVGKTFLAETIASKLHGSPDKLIRIDCSEFSQSHEIAKLIGAPPGYLGHRETQSIFSQKAMTDVISKNNSNPIIIFDEIEKAHSSLHRLLLGVLDRGILTTGTGEKVNFENSFIFFTSNLGFKTKTRQFNGFHENPFSNKVEVDSIKGEIKGYFPPEFLNRIDEVLFFNHLSEEALLAILDKEVNEIQRILMQRTKGKIDEISLKPDAISFIINKAETFAYGARELKRLIKREIFFPVLPKLREIEPESFFQLIVSVENDNLKFDLVR